MKVIQTRKPERELVGIATDERRLLHHRDDRDVAQTDRALPAEMLDGGLGHHARGIREVDKPCIGAQLAHIGDNLADDRDGAERLEHAASSVGLLAEHAVRQRNALVLDARVQQPHAELRGHEVRSRQRLPAIEGYVDLDVVPGRLPLTTGHLADDLDLLETLLDIHKPDLTNGQLVVAFDETLHELRGVAAPAADGDDLDSSSIRGSHSRSPFIIASCHIGPYQAVWKADEEARDASGQVGSGFQRYRASRADA